MYAQTQLLYEMQSFNLGALEFDLPSSLKLNLMVQYDSPYMPSY